MPANNDFLLNQLHNVVTQLIVHEQLGELTDELHQALRAFSAAQSASPEDARRIARDRAFAFLNRGQRSVLEDIASLQSKARRTFGDPMNPGDAWWVTRRGLQQSTHHAVAQLKASWLGDATVADLCSGLGGDLIAISKRGPTIGVDLDSNLLSFAQANLDMAGKTAELHRLDVMNTNVDGLVGQADYLHIDPDRRVNEQRYVRASDWMPTWDRVETLLGRCHGGLVKLAPATHLEQEATSEFHERFHRVWISCAGSVREQTFITGELLEDEWLRCRAMVNGGRSAIAIRGDQVAVFAGPATSSDEVAEITHQPREWMLDPDAAIRAAGLTGEFAGSIGAAVLGSESGFLTTTNALDNESIAGLAIAGRIREVTTVDDRKLRRRFRDLNAYPDPIKVRGANVDPARLGKLMRACGESPLGLWIGRDGARTYAVITDPPGLMG